MLNLFIQGDPFSDLADIQYGSRNIRKQQCFMVFRFRIPIAFKAVEKAFKFYKICSDTNTSAHFMAISLDPLSFDSVTSFLYVKLH